MSSKISRGTIFVSLLSMVVALFITVHAITDSYYLTAQQALFELIEESREHRRTTYLFYSRIVEVIYDDFGTYEVDTETLEELCGCCLSRD